MRRHRSTKSNSTSGTARRRTAQAITKGGKNLPYTVPNQRMVNIHRIRPTADFLGIKNENWQAAARDLGAHGLLLYLYFAANTDNYMLALSPVAIRQATGMPTSTYRDQFERLKDKGYLVQRGDGNIYDFFECPKRDTHALESNALRSTEGTADIISNTHTVEINAAEDREININNYINIDKCGEEKQVSPSPPRKEFRF